MAPHTPRPPGLSAISISMAVFKILKQIGADTVSTTVFAYPDPNFIITRSSLMNMIQQCVDTSSLRCRSSYLSKSDLLERHRLELSRKAITLDSIASADSISALLRNQEDISNRLSFAEASLRNLSDALSASLSQAFADFSSASALSTLGSMDALSVDISSILLESHACKELLASTRISCAARAKSVASLHARPAPPARPARMDAITEDRDFCARFDDMRVTFYEHYDEDDITLCREESPSASVSRMFIFECLLQSLKHYPGLLTDVKIGDNFNAWRIITSTFSCVSFAQHQVARIRFSRALMLPNAMSPSFPTTAVGMPSLLSFSGPAVQTSALTTEFRALWPASSGPRVSSKI
jgi:hypothetical protein